MKAITYALELIQNYRKEFLLTVIFLLIDTILASFVAFSIGPVIDLILNPDLKNISSLTIKVISYIKKLNLPVNILSMMTIFLIFQVLKSIFTVLITKQLAKIKYGVLGNLLLLSYDEFFQTKWSFFAESGQGTILNTFIREFNNVGSSFFFMGMFASKLLQIAIYLAVPFYISWKFTLIFIGIAACLFLPFFLLSKFAIKIGQNLVNTANNYSTTLKESLDGAKIILGFGANLKALKRMTLQFNLHRDAAITHYVFNAVIPEIAVPMGLLAIVLTFSLTPSQTIKISEMSIIVWSLKYAGNYLGLLAQYKTSIESFFPSYQQIISFRNKAKELKQITGEKKFNTLSDNIVFKNITFTHKGRELTIKDINMIIQKGKMTAITGESGAGKSTIIDLLMGFFTPSEGEILVNNIKLSEWDINSLREKIGYVPQEPILFNMSLRDNLLWSKSDATEEDIWESLKQTYSDDFIKELPEGLNTIIGDRGIKLSGGQRQRIALARAIIRKPEILVLDEATSSLDSHSEKLIQKAIENIGKKTTIIVIAHRLSTIKNAHTIYVLGNGNVIQSGNWESLKNQDGVFKNHLSVK